MFKYFEFVLGGVEDIKCCNHELSVSGEECGPEICNN